jgi:YVTN family beta-propeller protein
VISSLAVGDGSIWAALADGQRIVRIDPATLKVTATITNPLPVEWSPEIAYGDGAVWLSDAIPGVGSVSPTGALVRIDPATNAVVATVPVGRSPEGIAFTAGAVWTANHRSDQPQDAAPPHTFSVSKVDVASNTATGSVVVETRADTGDSWANFCCGPQGAAAGAGSVWVEDATTNQVSRIDPVTNVVTAQIANPGHLGCGNMAADDTSVWLTEGCDSPGLWRIDPASNSVTTTIRLPGAGGDVQIGFGSVWVSTGFSSLAGSKETLTRIDPQTNRIVGRTAIPGAGPLAVGDGVLWMGSGSTLLELRPA